VFELEQKPLAEVMQLVLLDAVTATLSSPTLI